MITCNEPIWNRFFDSSKDAILSSPCFLIAGLLEGFIKCFGFRSSVEVMFSPTSKYPNKTIYFIKYK